MFTIILMITIQIEKKLIAFHDMIADITTNKKFQVIIKVTLAIKCISCIYHTYYLFILFFCSKRS